MEMDREQPVRRTDIDLSIVIPAFNEESRIRSTLEQLANFLSEMPLSWEIIVVDDGSSDATSAVVSTCAETIESIKLESRPHRGKGGAVRHGMLTASGRYRFLCDADLAMPIQFLNVFIHNIKKDLDIVIGSRQRPGARRFNEPITRHVSGRVFNWIVRMLAVRGFQDTQCGFKCFRGDVTEVLFALQQIDGFGFDVELLYLAKKYKMRVMEIPIEWYHQKSSKVRPLLDPILMLCDVIRVRWNEFLGKYRYIPRFKYFNISPPPRSETSLDVVIPTYNEAANLTELVERFFALGIPDSRIIIVDDNSPDGTGRVARKLCERFAPRIDLIERQDKFGLGTAYICGFARALESGAKYIGQMDADLSHSPEQIPGMLKALQRTDVVVGSRYVSGGDVAKNWGNSRRILSYFANRGIRFIGGLNVKDVTSGFKIFKSGAIVELDPRRLHCKGFAFQSEVAFECQRRGLLVIEYPIVFAERMKGASKMSFWIALEALFRLAFLRLRR